ncbi:MAG: lipopolysaccharide assembly protein LapA domain-containing protein [Candidatus Methylomirabilia bacterium]
MPWVYFIVAAAASVVAIFALQNADPVTVRFLAWQVEGVPLAAAILASGALAAVAASLVGLVQRWKLRAHIRQLESRLKQAELPKPAE